MNIVEKTPPGFEKVVRKLKGKVNNPWAVAWSMKNKGAKPHESQSHSLTVQALSHAIVNDEITVDQAIAFLNQ